jgi:hypothetical protein
MTEPPEPPQPSFDEMQSRHEDAVVQEGDIMDVARLFNQVGSSLSKIDNMNLDSTKPAMRLEKEKVLEIVKSTSKPDPHPQPPPVPPVAPGSTINHPPPTTPPLSHPSVTVDHKTYNQHIKKMGAVSRKLSKIEKELVNLKNIVDVDSRSGKYKLVTDNTELTTADPTLLLSTISKQLDNKSKEIIISRC